MNDESIFKVLPDDKTDSTFKIERVEGRRQALCVFVLVPSSQF